MAKSLRSKRRRKMRAVKRVRYGEKELDRLKKTLANDTTTTKKEIDEVMTDISEIATVSDAKTVKEKRKSKKTTDDTDTEVIEVDGVTAKHSYNTRTMKDQFGSYPVWMSQRKIREKVKAYKKKVATKKKKSRGKK